MRGFICCAISDGCVEQSGLHGSSSVDGTVVLSNTVQYGRCFLRSKVMRCDGLSLARVISPTYCALRHSLSAYSLFVRFADCSCRFPVSLVSALCLCGSSSQ